MSETVEMEKAPGGGRRVWRRAQVLFLNPLLVRDLRFLLRGRRPFLLQSGYLLLLIIAMGLAAFFVRQERLMAGGMASSSINYGEMMFYALFETQVVLLFLILIAYSAGSIALEYEKRTFEMVSVTTLSSLEIVVGKVASITALCWMLLLTSAPLAAVCLLLGGVAPGQIALSYALFAYAIIALAAAGVLFSTVAGRTISAFVVGLICIGAWAVLTAVFSGGDPSIPSLGMLSPLGTPFIWHDDFRLFAHSVPAWISPLVVHGLTGALCLVAAAEALPLHRPRRSTALRLLLFSLTFVVCFLYAAAALEHARSAGNLVAPAAQWQRGPSVSLFTHPFWEPIRGWLVLAWLSAGLIAPIFSSYAAPPEAKGRLFAWLLAPVAPWRWLRRDGNVGWRATLLFFAIIVAAALLPPVIANLTGLVGGQAFSAGSIGLFAFSTLLLMVSLFGYSAWTVGMCAAWRDRRVGALCAVMIMLLLNVIGVYYIANPYGFRRLTFLVHPLVALTSPVPAALGVIGSYSSARYWREAWSNPIFLIGVSFIYQVLIAAGALHYLRRLDRRAKAAAEKP